MSTDLSTNPSEVAENNSLREVLLFCLVLVVEVYSLAVAFGGPFFEVGYFLLVVIGQTTAGAYIWAQLRQSDKTLPLPELLAMGFAIGSASAAISQLILRDLLGIRIFLSPLVPIIGVAIWLAAKRNTRLPVTITHANTNTLLWLLFPAPLAMSFFIWQLNILFVIPLALFALFNRYSKLNTYFGLIVVIGSIIALFGFVLNTMQRTSVALSLIGWDEMFDESMALGFSNWGVGDHIGRTGNSVAYYKLSHLWFGPLHELSNSPPMVITTSIVPLAIFALIGLALWTLSYRIYRSDSAAGLASILVFLQCAFPEPENFAIRIAQSLVIVYSLATLNALMKAWANRTVEVLVVASLFFVIFATRAQYGLVLLVGFSIHKLALLLQKRASFYHQVSLMAATALSLSLCFVIFFNEASHATGSPNQGSALQLFGLFISVIGFRSLLPLLTLSMKDYKQEHLLMLIILSSALIYFLLPQSYLSNAPSLIIALLVSVLASNEVSKLQKSLNKALFATVLVLASAFGFFLRFFYDLFKWTDKTNMRTIFKPLVAMATDGRYVAFYNIAPFTAFIAILLIWSKIKQQPLNWRPIVLLTALSMSFGIWFATNYRSVTALYRYDIEFTGVIEPDSTMSWYVDADRLQALEWMRNNSKQDDIFAQNTSTPDYWNTAFSASLIISGSIHRRAYIEGVQSTELQRDFPRHVSHQTDRQRKELLRLNTSFRFPITPNETMLKILQSYNVKWFVVDLGNTELRDWEPYATTRFMNEKVAILELAQLPAPSN